MAERRKEKLTQDLFRFTLIALQIYTLGGVPTAEEGGSSNNHLSGKLCQQEH
jgi:hypothetical protein